jgi:hypothetical protein
VLVAAASVVAVIAAAVGGWAAWNRPAVGPLQTSSVGGQPSLGMTSDAVLRGTCVDAEAYVTNTASDAVTLVRVSAVPLPGENLGHVACAGVATTGHGVAGASGWPVSGVPVEKVAGARLPHGDSGIVFGITGPAKDRYYAVAGILVTYEYHGHLYSVTAWAGDLACVVPTLNYSSKVYQADNAACAARDQKDNDQLEALVP